MDLKNLNKRAIALKTKSKNGIEDSISFRIGSVIITARLKFAFSLKK